MTAFVNAFGYCSSRTGSLAGVVVYLAISAILKRSSRSCYEMRPMVLESFWTHVFCMFREVFQYYHFQSTVAYKLGYDFQVI
jgi:hypothetical protein